MKYIEVVDKQEVLHMISDAIENCKKRGVGCVPSELLELHYEISNMRQYGYFEIDADDCPDWDPFYKQPSTDGIRPC